VLVQHGWTSSPFRNQPRIERELGLSMLRGRISLEKVTQYVLQGELPTERQLKKSRIRRTTAAELRRKGFAIVHTPRRIPSSVHCTIVWPDDKPLEAPQVPWPPDVSERFDSCFNEETGGIEA
jgi:hypothetical protein